MNKHMKMLSLSAGVVSLPLMFTGVALGEQAEGQANTISDEVVTAMINESLPLVLNEDDFSLIRSAINPDQSQSEAIAAAFRDYQTSIQVINNDAGPYFRGLISEAASLSEEEQAAHYELLADAAAETEQFMRQARSQTLTALQVLQARVNENLNESQQQQFSKALRDWRRGELLNSFDSGPARRDLDSHPDLIYLESQAFAFEDFPPEVSGALNSVLEEYAANVDVLLQSQFTDQQETILQANTRAMQGDVNAAENARSYFINNWLAVYDLTTNASEEAASVLEENGFAQAAENWRNEVFRAYFPQLYAPKTADTAYRWATSSDVLSDSQKNAIAEMYLNFNGQRAQLRRNMRNQLLRAMREENILPGMIGFMRLTGDLPAYVDQVTMERRDLNDRFLNDLRSVLNEQQNGWMDQALEDAAAENSYDGEAPEF